MDARPDSIFDKLSTPGDGGMTSEKDKGRHTVKIDRPSTTKGGAADAFDPEAETTLQTGRGGDGATRRRLEGQLLAGLVCTDDDDIGAFRRLRLGLESKVSDTQLALLREHLRIAVHALRDPRDRFWEHLEVFGDDRVLDESTADSHTDPQLKTSPFLRLPAPQPPNRPSSVPPSDDRQTQYPVDGGDENEEASPTTERTPAVYDDDSSHGYGYAPVPSSPEAVMAHGAPPPHGHPIALAQTPAAGGLPSATVGIAPASALPGSHTPLGGIHGVPRSAPGHGAAHGAAGHSATVPSVPGHSVPGHSAPVPSVPGRSVPGRSATVPSVPVPSAPGPSAPLQGTAAHGAPLPSAPSPGAAGGGTGPHPPAAEASGAGEEDPWVRPWGQSYAPAQGAPSVETTLHSGAPAEGTPVAADGYPVPSHYDPVDPSYDAIPPATDTDPSYDAVPGYPPLGAPSTRRGSDAPPSPSEPTYPHRSSHPEPSPPPAPVEAAAQLEPIVSLAHGLALSVDEYAGLCAERDHQPPHAVAATHRRYDIHATASWEATRQAFALRFSRDPALRHRWEQAYYRFAAYLRQRR